MEIKDSEDRKDEDEEEKKLAEKYNILFFECSEIGNNIVLSFNQLNVKIIEKQKEEANNKDRNVRNDERKSLRIDKDVRKRQN